ncbi:SEC14-like protein 2 [Orchesella cincta]|uniref:SEC14-like protein 2 n=1 Tax=Orchesella cincta TaxID=48709 RepID=A0A1D2MUY7_ORCCI|nr:SEC14-like protein 2 [Orchesella cincta]
MSVEDLNNRERVSLDKLIKRTTDLDFNEGTLLRFLRARNLDVKKAEAMLRDSVIWRKENEYRYFGSTYEFWEPPPEITAGYDIYHCGYDAENRPVYYAPLGMWASAYDMFKKGLEDDCLRFAGKSMDQVHKQLLTTKHQNFVCIVDNTGVTLRKALYESQNFAGIQDLIRLFREYEANFPETLHKAFVINTPQVFYLGYNIVKPLMTKHTLSKINIFNCDETQWLPAIHEHIPIHAIPEKFGGTALMKPLWPFDKTIV